MDAITLIGAEDVRHAGYMVSGAAQDLTRTVANLSAAIERFGGFVERFEQAVERLILDGPTNRDPG